MAAIFPKSAENVVVNLLFKGIAPAGVTVTSTVLRLFTNDVVAAAGGLSNNVMLSHFTEATGAGYAAVTLAATDWVITDGTAVADVAKTKFAATGTWPSDVKGYYVASTGVTPVVLYYQVDSTGYTFVDGSKYEITLDISVS